MTPFFCSSGCVSTSSVSVTPTQSTITKWVFPLRVGRDSLRVIVVDHADAAALHLLEEARGSSPCA